MLVQLFLLSMVKTSGAICNGGDLDCQTYLMKWNVTANWLIAIGVLIFAFTVSRISYKEKIISRKERFISIILYSYIIL